MAKTAIFHIFIIYLNCIVQIAGTIDTTNSSALWNSYESVDSFSERFGHHKVDLVFVLDRSGSIPHSGWQSIISFMYSVLEHFTVDALNTRVAVITYSTRVSVDLNDLTNARENKCSLMQRLRQRVEPKVTSGYTSTNSALRTAYTLLINTRREAKKAVIVLTDGRSNIGSPPVDASVDIRALRWSPFWDSQANGPQVEIFAFGVQDAQWPELKSIATPLPNHTYFLPEFSEYRDLAQLLHKGRQKETWEVTGRAESCSDDCSPHSECVCSTGTGQYTCLCKPGYYGNGFRCTACPYGQYKESLRPGLCSHCPGNLTTLTTASISAVQCRCEPPYVDRGHGNDSCSIQLCPELPSIANGDSFHVWGISQSEIPATGEACQNTAGDACHYVCGTGYRLHGLPALVCNLNGTWLGELPECKVVDCHRLQDHGELDAHAAIDYINRTTTYGSVVSVACQRGWRLFGSGQRVCRETGIWGGVPMRCIEAECPSLPNLQQGSITPDTCSHGRQIPGSVCSYQCKDGYQMIGPGEKSCDYHGQWDNNTMTSCVDIMSPEITCPADITLPATSGNSAIVYWDHEQPHASDNSGRVILSRVVPFTENPATIQIGYHQLRYIATDLTGNTASCSRSISIIERSIHIGHCPQNITLANVPGLGQTVDWSAPQFYDHNDQVLEYQCTKPSGSFFSLGSHLVMCYPSDRYDKTCRFTVELKRKECQRPPPPQNGAYSCSSTPTFLWVCSVHCDENFSFYQQPRTFYHCDLNGVWNSPRLWPHCSRKRLASRAVAKGHMEYWYFGGNCEEEKGQIAEIFKSKVERYAMDYCLHWECTVTNVDVQCADGTPSRKRRNVDETTPSGSTSTSTADNSETRNVESTDIQDTNPTAATSISTSQTQSPSIQPDDISVNQTIQPIVTASFDSTNPETAGVSNIPQSSQAISPYPVTALDSVSSNSITIVFNVESSLPEEENITDVKQMDLMYELHDMVYYITSDFNSNSTHLDIPEKNITRHTSQNVSVMSVPAFILNCAPGQISKENYFSSECVNCPIGTYRWNDTSSCVLCSVGEYQDLEQQTGCKSCPAGMTTEGNGTIDYSSCRNPCPRGSVSPNGLEPCDFCDISYFQPEEGKSSCEVCPGDQSTVGPGAESAESCRGICMAGSFNESSGLEPCELCPMHMYQPANGSLSCLPCPRNTGTTQQGATSVEMCTRMDYCANMVTEPCLNGGQCQSDGDSFTCDCEEGFKGLLCDIEIDLCVSAPCLNNATCRQDSSTIFTCECIQGYTGLLCESEIDECSSGPCQNGGSCQDMLGDFQCYCGLGWSGERCDEDINECQSNPCAHGHCENEENGFVCQCNTGFVGELCETRWSVCDSQPCENEGVCEDWAQGSFTCTCPDGFLGSLCEIPIDECKGEPCQHGGTCLDQINGYSCQCPWGYMGNSCQTGVSPDFDLVFQHTGEAQFVSFDRELPFPELTQFTITFWMRSSDSRNFGTILSYSSLSDWNDDNELLDEFSLLDYGRLKISINSDEVDTGIRLTTGLWMHVTVTWQSSGHWSVYINSSMIISGSELAQGQVIRGQGHLVIGQTHEATNGFINARESFIGELSHVNIYDFVLADDVIISSVNHETCSSEPHGNVLGWTQVLTADLHHVTVRKPSACLDVNECIFPETFSCGPRRVCTDLIGGYNCDACIYGYHGPRCDQPIDECLNNPCLHGATCQDGPDIFDFQCTCMEGFTGNICEHEINPCDSNLCFNNGSCVRTGSDFRCDCPLSGVGARCEDLTGPCERHPCRNGGFCLLIGQNRDTARCTCTKEYMGDNCEQNVSPCEHFICNNGGTCLMSEDKNTPYCSCTSFYAGQTCDVFIATSCSLSPCQNNGTCIPVFNSVQGFQCLCPENALVTWDYYCNIENPCESNPCENSGTCIHFSNQTFICACPPDVAGRLCEQRINDSSTSTTVQTKNVTLLRPCVGVQCLNGGTCFQIDSTIVCHCVEDFKGKFCEEEREKEYRLYYATLKLLTTSPTVLIQNRESFEKQFQEEVLSKFAAQQFEGSLGVLVRNLRENEDGIEVTFELAYDWYKDSMRTAYLLTNQKIESTLKSLVSRGQLGPYQLSRDGFLFEEKSSGNDNLRIYLSVGVASGVLLSLLLIVWIVWRRMKDRRSTTTISDTTSSIFTTDSILYSPYRRPSLLNNTHEMVILNPIGNPAYQSETDQHSRTGAENENLYAELSDVPMPYVVTSKGELKEAFLLRRYSSKRSKDSNIELAAAMKAGQEKQKWSAPPGACAVEDDYLKPVTLPRNEFSKESKTSSVNQLPDNGYLSLLPEDTPSATLPARLRTFNSGARSTLIGAESRTASLGRTTSLDSESRTTTLGSESRTSTLRSDRGAAPPDYLEVCPPTPEDDLLPEIRRPRCPRSEPEGRDRKPPQSARHRDHPPLPPIPVDDQV